MNSTVLEFPRTPQFEPFDFSGIDIEHYFADLHKQAAALKDALAGRKRLGSQKSIYKDVAPMLFAALGVAGEARTVSDALPHSIEMLDWVDLRNALSNLGFTTCEEVLDAASIDARLVPCLFLQEARVYVILEMNEEHRTIRVYDAEHDTILQLNKDEFGVGQALLVNPRDSIRVQLEEATRRASGNGWFRNMLQRFRGLTLQIIGVGMMINMISLSVPLLIMLVYDRVVGAAATQDMNYLTMGFALAMLTEMTLRHLRARQVGWLAARLDLLTATAIINRLLRLPPALIERASVASQLSRIKGFEEIRDFFTGPLFITMMELPFVLVLVLAIALIGGSLAVVPLAMTALYVGVVIAARPLTRRAMHKAARLHATRHEMVLETFEEMSGIRTAGMQSVWSRRFRMVSGEASLASFRSGQIAAALETFAYTLTVLAGLVTLYLGVSAVLANEMTAGALVACMMLTWRVLAPLSMLCTSLPRIEQLYQTISQVNRLMELQVETDRPANARLDTLAGRIQFTNVGLRYQTAPDPVFAGLNFTARPGELIAITGNNGAGKSSILKLMNGLYAPQAGTIRIDGMDIRQFHPVALRRRIAYVPQHPDFFTGSVAENLRIANPLATQEEMLEALAMAGARAEVEALPHGLDTMVSGGQFNDLPASLAHRINLARTCLSDAPIVLCDELPYALLANKSDTFFRTLLEQWKRTRTVIMVSHRTDYILFADRAIGLRSGLPPAVGTPHDVLRLVKGASYDGTNQIRY